MEEFHRIRREIINDTIQNPRELIIWLYQEQGPRRFDSANRFFLILIDLQNLENSWKLKRNRELLSEGITNYLNENREIDFNNLRITFNWEEEEYNTFATTLFLVRNQE